MFKIKENCTFYYESDYREILHSLIGSIKRGDIQTKFLIRAIFEIAVYEADMKFSNYEPTKNDDQLNIKKSINDLINHNEIFFSVGEKANLEDMYNFFKSGSHFIPLENNFKINEVDVFKIINIIEIISEKIFEIEYLNFDNIKNDLKRGSWVYVKKENSLVTIDIKFYDFLEITKVINIPFIQRKYLWKESNFERLLFSLKENPFLGTVIVAKNKNKKFFIDGQQRVLTIIMMFKALSIKLSPIELEKNGMKFLNNFLNKINISNDTGYKNDVNLIINSKNKREIIELSASPEKECFLFWDKKMEEIKESLIDIAKSLSLSILTIPEKMFETLFLSTNEQGVPLTWDEKIKARIVSRSKDNWKEISIDWRARIEPNLSDNTPIYNRYYSGLRRSEGSLKRWFEEFDKEIFTKLYSFKEADKSWEKKYYKKVIFGIETQLIASKMISTKEFLINGKHNNFLKLVYESLRNSGSAQHFLIYELLKLYSKNSTNGSINISDEDKFNKLSQFLWLISHFKRNHRNENNYDYNDVFKFLKECDFTNIRKIISEINFDNISIIRSSHLIILMNEKGWISNKETIEFSLIRLSLDKSIELKLGYYGSEDIYIEIANDKFMVSSQEGKQEMYLDELLDWLGEENIFLAKYLKMKNWKEFYTNVKEIYINQHSEILKDF